MSMSEEAKVDEDHLLLEAFLENVEAGLELATGNEILTAIPVVSTAFNISKAIHGIRERVFIAKLTRFVNDPSLMNPEIHRLLHEMTNKEPDNLRKVGEALFLVLESLTDMEKPELLAKVLSGFARGRINRDELLRLMQAIDTGYIDDLMKLASAPSQTSPSDNLWMQSLLPSGLTIQGVPGPIGGRLIYNVTNLGQALQRALAA